MFAEAGLAGMFVCAFLAATLLPLGSEAVLLALLYADYPVIPLIITATAGNVGGSLVNYWLGWRFGRAGIMRIAKVPEHRLVKAEHQFRLWGRWSLCLAWVPVIGDPLTFIAGILRISPVWFVVLVTAGKASRYIIISQLAA